MEFLRARATEGMFEQLSFLFPAAPCAIMWSNLFPCSIRRLQHSYAGLRAFSDHVAWESPACLRDLRQSVAANRTSGRARSEVDWGDRAGALGPMFEFASGTGLGLWDRWRLRSVASEGRQVRR